MRHPLEALMSWVWYKGTSAIVLQASRSALVRQAVSIMVLGFLGLVLDV